MKPVAGGSKKIFIVGVGRSGTSLLQVILASHPEIAFLPETGFARRYLMRGKLDKACSVNGSQGVARLLKSDVRLSRLPKEILDKIPQLAGEISHSNTHQLLDLSAYEIMHQGVSSQYTGDKDPRLVEHINLLFLLWPDAKIIHLYRDPRDIIVSKKKAEWSRRKSMLSLLLSTCAQFHMGDKATTGRYATSLFSLKYESLVSTPDKELGKLCDWLGLHFDPSMLNFSSTAEALVFDDERQWKSEVLGPLLAGNFDKWSDSLSTLETLLIQSSCSQAMSKGAYRREIPPSFFLKIVSSIGGYAINSMARLYILSRNINNYLNYRAHFGKRNS